MKTKLVIFDCDGVLVDTEAIANNRMAELFTDYGFAISGSDCRKRFQGKLMEDVCRQVAELAGKSYDPSFPKMIRDTVAETLANGVEPIPGVIDLVHKIVESGIPYCVASSGSVSKMHLTLGHVGLLPFMKGRLFSAQDVARGKPHPDVFIAAAGAMNLSCTNAVILEDSVSGVQAGVASGARVLGYAGDPFTDGSALADAGAEIFHHMDEVPDLIGLR